MFNLLLRIGDGKREFRYPLTCLSQHCNGKDLAELSASASGARGRCVTNISDLGPERGNFTNELPFQPSGALQAQQE
ncbi:hypothetical protein TNCV_2594011 [Trichonephila clavipes]|nr:hypothetical protein TNCV_2594011 [Trichonephila clavipes]